MNIEWQERLAPLSNRITTLSRLLEMAAHQLDRSNQEARVSGQALLLDAAAEAEQIHSQLKDVVDELAGTAQKSDLARLARKG